MTATELLAADAAGIARAAALLRAGELVGFGTETVYGLGADATNERAVAAVFAAFPRELIATTRRPRRRSRTWRRRRWRGGWPRRSGPGR